MTPEQALQLQHVDAVERTRAAQAVDALLVRLNEPRADWPVELSSGALQELTEALRETRDALCNPSGDRGILTRTNDHE
jgi:ABC-type transporter Mla subunit MlaD